MSFGDKQWIDIANHCAVRPDNIVLAWKNRETLNLHGDKLLILGDPLDRKCWPSTFAGAGKLGIQIEVNQWRKWIQTKLPN